MDFGFSWESSKGAHHHKDRHRHLRSSLTFEREGETIDVSKLLLLNLSVAWVLSRSWTDPLLRSYCSHQESHTIRPFFLSAQRRFDVRSNHLLYWNPLRRPDNCPTDCIIPFNTNLYVRQLMRVVWKINKKCILVQTICTFFIYGQTVYISLAINSARNS